jgi:tetratricopeptide (TPR) repeat protein
VYINLQFPGSDLPAELASFVHEKTEGNPLFMVDLLQYLRNRGVIAQAGDRWVLTEDILDIGRELPESIDGMIQRKVNQLGDNDRRLLTAASVQGKEFDSAVIAKALGIGAPEVEEQLENLEQTHSFVHAIGEQEFPNGSLTTRYKFVHGLYQNALYSSLRSARRVVLSATIADALLENYGEKHAAAAAKLALLFETARDFARAERFFLLAAKNASELFAYQEAIALSRRGLALAGKNGVLYNGPPVEIGLQVTLGTSLIPTKGLAAPEVEHSFARAYELIQQTEGSPQIFAALRGLSLFYINRPKLDRALDLGEQLLRLAEAQEDPALLYEALYSLGSAYYFRGEPRAAVLHLQRAITSGESANQRARSTLFEQNAMVGCLAIASFALWSLGFPDQALERSRQSIELAEQLRQPYSLSRALSWASLLYLILGDWERCSELADRSITLSETSHFPHWLAIGTFYKGYTMFQLGRRRAGIETMRNGLDMAAATGGELGRPFFLALLGEALGLNGRVEEALRLVDEALSIVDRDGQCSGHAEIYRIKGGLCLLETEPQEVSLNDETAAYPLRNAAPGAKTRAAACYRHAIEIARAQGSTSIELRAALDLAELLASEGERDKARGIIAEVYHQFIEGFSTPDLMRAAGLLTALDS